MNLSCLTRRCSGGVAGRAQDRAAQLRAAGLLSGCLVRQEGEADHD